MRIVKEHWIINYIFFYLCIIYQWFLLIKTYVTRIVVCTSIFIVKNIFSGAHVLKAHFGEYVYKNVSSVCYNLSEGRNPISLNMVFPSLDPLHVNYTNESCTTCYALDHCPQCSFPQIEPWSMIGVFKEIGGPVIHNVL